MWQDERQRKHEEKAAKEAAVEVIDMLYNSSTLSTATANSNIISYSDTVTVSLIWL